MPDILLTVSDICNINLQIAYLNALSDRICRGISKLRNMTNLSVIIISKNAAQHLEVCLESVKWADEIIVLDSGSTDETVAIAKRYTTHVHITDWPGFGAQKNRALSYATHPWVLSIDADEWLSAALQSEIQNIVNSDCRETAFYIRRQSYYCGKLIRHGSWGKDDCLRLFKNGTAEFTNDLIHEKIITHGSIGKLKEILYHQAYDNLDQVIQKMNQYSTLGAKMRADRGKQASLSQAIMHALWSFLHGYLFRLGFLDGREGFMLAISNAEGCYYRYLKLMYLTRNLAPEKLN